MKNFFRRRTKQRDMVLNAIHTLDHPTAQEAYSHIINAISCYLEEKISLGTIYRNLQILEDEGKIIPVPAGKNAMRYDARIDSHYHLLCIKCGRVVDMPVAYKKIFDFDAEKRSGFRIESHSVLFRGMCADCL